MKQLFSLVVLCLFTTIGFSQSNTETKVWSNVEALNNAVFGNKDSIVMKRLTSEKLSYGHSGGNIEDKRKMVTGASSSKTEYRNITVEKLGFTLEGKTAVARYILRAGSVEKGVETPLNIAILTVWVKKDGDWKLLARQAVKVAEKK
ncbi:MAG: nuclear transport factor 2 family protein [Segetibacter sp.]|nr:nuclear transport factor 2 family protein [Segetibacter sp.]